MFQMKVVAKSKTHSLCPVTFLFSENRAVYNKMSENMMELEMPQAIWRMRVACWISKATRTKAHARARVPTPTHASTRTYSPTHAHTNTPTVVSRTRLLTPVSCQC